jgi:murein endopeptidase
VRGVQLPSSGPGFATWDPVLKERPNREWRRWGNDHVVRATLRVIDRYRAAHPNAPKLLIGDLSRPRGGDFGARWGLLGHVSHQNGLDVDVYFPRKDGRLVRPDTPAQVDQRLGQWLVDAFLAEGAELIFTGPNLQLSGPPAIVLPLDHHDDHLHIRFPNPDGPSGS